MSGLFCKDIAVLDVNSKSICAIIGSKKTQSVFGVKSIVEKDHQGFGDGEWFDRHDTFQVAKSVLTQCLDISNSRTRRLFISVPAEFTTIVTKEESVQLDKKRLINQEDVRFLFKKGASFNSTEYCLINSKPIYYVVDDSDSLVDSVDGMIGQKIDACISYVLAEKSYVLMFDQVATELGFTDIIFVATPLSECLSLLDQEQRDDIYSLIDIGYLSSSVMIGKGDGILDMKSFSLGSGHIAADIYEALDVPFENALEAQQLVDLNLNYSEDAILVGNSTKNIMATDVVDITKYELDQFVDIINNIYSSLIDYLPSNMKVYLTGEGIAPVRGAKKYLSEQLGKNIEIVTPKLPGFVKAEYGSKISLLLMADSMSNNGFIEKIKRLFVGGRRK